VALITGGTVTATGNDCAAGIGGTNNSRDGDDVNGGTITISGGTTTANGGTGGGAGIGGGKKGNGGTIQISGGTVYANGKDGGAGIGGGLQGGSGTLQIRGGRIYATGAGAAGIGDGDGYNGNNGSISISGGTIIADGGTLGTGIGSESIFLITDACVFASSIKGRASNPEGGIATGNHVNIDHSAKTITLYTYFTVPKGATLALPPDWTLNENGYIVNSGAALRNAAAAAGSGGIDDTVLPQFVVYVKDGWLYVNSPVEEHIFIYSISGTLLYKTDAIPADTETKVVELRSISASGSIVIVRGRSGWHKKIII
jgi:hypothetical protein